MRDSLRRWAVIPSILAAGVLAWWLLRPWVPGDAERFYLLVPPVGFGVFLLCSPNGVQRCKAGWRPFAMDIAYLFFCGLVFSLLLTWPLLSAATGRTFGHWGLELLIGVYFLLALRLLLGAFTRGLRRLAAWLDARWYGATQDQRPWGRRLLGFLPVVVLVLLVPPYFLGTMYVHRFRIPNVDPLPSLPGRTVEDVEFGTVDGLTLRGWFIPAEQPSTRTLLICHGLGGNRSLFLPYVAVGDALNANVLLFDFRGHGDSEGHTVSFGYRERLDVLAAVDYLRRQRPEQARSVLGLGVSMGSSGLIAAAAEVEPPLAGVIIDSGFASASELTDSILRVVPEPLRSGLAGVGMPVASLHAGCWLPDVRPVEQIGRLRAPVLFIHARGDDMIPVAQGLRLHEQAAAPKSIWIAETTGHSSALSGARADYLQTVMRWDNGSRQGSTRFGGGPFGSSSRPAFSAAAASSCLPLSASAAARLK